MNISRLLDWLVGIEPMPEALDPKNYDSELEAALAEFARAFVAEESPSWREV